MEPRTVKEWHLSRDPSDEKELAMQRSMWEPSRDPTAGATRSSQGAVRRPVWLPVRRGVREGSEREGAGSQAEDGTLRDGEVAVDFHRRQSPVSFWGS